MFDFATKKTYKKTKFLGLYKIDHYGTAFFLFECDTGDILVESFKGQPLIFIDQEFIDNHFINLGTSKLLEILYGLYEKE